MRRGKAPKGSEEGRRPSRRLPGWRRLGRVQHAQGTIRDAAHQSMRRWPGLGGTPPQRPWPRGRSNLSETRQGWDLHRPSSGMLLHRRLLRWWLHGRLLRWRCGCHRAGHTAAAQCLVQAEGGCRRRDVGALCRLRRPRESDVDAAWHRRANQRWPGGGPARTSVLLSGAGSLGIGILAGVEKAKGGEDPRVHPVLDKAVICTRLVDHCRARDSGCPHGSSDPPAEQIAKTRLNADTSADSGAW
mmetsp:Transcript_103578/g.263056  ORF Transcript_103578/g.263056 Transcript_103578/m.263056 type:complete len:244 (-) Transcript_103578:103-834(-)